MKAIVLGEYGGPDQLKYLEVPDPVAKAGQVLVHIHATSLNPVDLKRASGKMSAIFPVEFPFIPGGDFSGTVEAVGEGVTSVVVGDEVFGYAMEGGAYAEYIVIDESKLALKPKQSTHVEAASLAMVGQTATQMLENAKLVAGQTMLVLGAGGAVGSILIQLAHAKDAKIIAVAYPQSLKRLQAMGADEAIDSTTPLSALPGEMDVVMDCIGGPLVQQAFSKLRRGGVLLSITMPPSPEEASKAGVRAEMVFTVTSSESLRALAEMVDRGDIAPFVGRTYPLQEVALGWRKSTSEHVEGKIVFTVA